MKTTYLTLALAAAGFTAAAVAHAQPAPAPTAPPAPPAPTASTDPNAPPPPAAPAPAPAPTTTSTAAPSAPPPAAPTDPNAPPADPNAPPAQGDPNAPPPPPPVAPPPPPPVTAPTTAPTAPPVFVPPPVITQPTTPPATPAPATPAAPAKKPEGMTMLQRFAATAFWWNNTVGASLLGIDAKARSGEVWNGATGQFERPSGYIGSEGDFYSQSFTFRPAFFLYRGGSHQVRALANITVNTELTNSDTTTKRNQPDFFDIPITLSDTISLAGWGGGSGASAAAIARDPTLAGAPEYKLWGVIAGQALIPASRASREGGMYMGTSLSLGLRQQIKLFGSSSDYLGNVTFTLSEAWQHQFWRASTATKLDLDIPRQTSNGGPMMSDQLRPGALVENRLIHTLAMFLPIYGDLMMFSSFQLWNDFPHQFKGNECEVTISTGCVDLPESERKMRATTSFDVSLYYQILPELGLDVGYSNFTGQIGDNGQWRNPFFSPSSAFYTDVYVFLDQVVKRVTTPAKPPANVGKL